MKSELEEKLFNQEVLQSDQDLTILLEQYKLYVETMDKVSERRHQANSFFLTTNTILVTMLGFIIQDLSSQSGLILSATIVGIIFCLTWGRLINSYSQLNGGKFKIIHLLESRLPARLFDAEWDALNHGDGSVYKPFTHMEKWVPIVFMGLYGLLALFTLVELCDVLANFTSTTMYLLKNSGQILE